MLGITARRGALTVALSLVPATALAAKTGADVWKGKIGKVATVQIVRDSAQPKQASAYVSYTCVIAGAKQTFSVTTSGPVKHNKIKFSGSTDDGLGTAKISAKLSKPKAKGKFSVSEDEGMCKVSGKFKAKYSHVTGG